MAGSMLPPGVRRPKRWSRRIQSVVNHAISLAYFSLTSTRSWAANSGNARVRLSAENDRLRQEVALLNEELRIKDARMIRIPTHRRPHYPPIERLAILALLAARGCSMAQTARRLLVTTTTVASWMSSLDERGPDSLVQMRDPVNKLPEFPIYIAQRPKVICPAMGKVKIAQVLCRAGLHLGPTTVRWMLSDTHRRRPSSRVRAFGRSVRAKRLSHIGQCDLSTVPTSLGF